MGNEWDQGRVKRDMEKRLCACHVPVTRSHFPLISHLPFPSPWERASRTLSHGFRPILLRGRLALRRLLPALGPDRFEIFGCVAQRLALVQPAVLELRLGIRVPVHLVRRSLAALAGTDLLTFPPRLG